MSLRDDLIAARALIDTPEKWCQGAYGRGRQLCAIGAGRQVTGKIDGGEEFKKAMIAALPAHLGPFAFPHEYNDRPETTHADVMSWFDRAIEAAS